MFTKFVVLNANWQFAMQFEIAIDCILSNNVGQKFKSLGIFGFIKV